MHELFDYLGTPTGGRLLGIVGNLITIVAAILSGKALSNTVQLKKAIGNTIEHGPFQVLTGLFRRGPKRGRTTSAMLSQPQSSIQEQLDGLKTTYERNWVQTGIRLTDAEKRLDRIDPKTRRH